MRAAILREAKAGLVIEDVEIDNPQDDEVLVRVMASGLCHSDLHYVTGDLPLQGPTILGHEVAGIVEAIGEGVTSVRPGDAVVACSSGYCSQCIPCVTGRTHLCESRPDRIGPPSRITLGGEEIIQGTRVGGFAEEVLLHENFLVKIPSELPFDRAALLGCGVLTGVGSVLNSAKVTAGSRVVVIGCGGVGLNIVQGARIAGAAQIIAVDISPTKLELAAKFGATDLVTGGEDAVEAVLAASGGGVDFAFEAIGLVTTIGQAAQMLAVSGLLTLVGVTAPQAKAEFPVFPTVLKELRIQGALMGSAPFKRDIPRFANMYLDGALDLDTLVSGRIRLSDINAGFTAMTQGSVARSVIVFE